MRLTMINFLLLSAFTLIANNTLAADYSFIGKAYDLDSNELLYTEYHTYISPILHKVEYKEANGNVFATKIINYEKSFFSPDFSLENTRNGEFIRTKKENENITLEYKENSKSSTLKSLIKDKSTLVIDAGFDHFIMSNWQELITGKSIEVNYLIPSKGDYYRLNLNKISCDDSNSDDYCFSISASSFFIRIFSSELKLTYSPIENIGKNITDIKDTKQAQKYRLTSFKGRTNISDSKGNYQDAHIRYQF